MKSVISVPFNRNGKIDDAYFDILLEGSSLGDDLSDAEADYLIERIELENRFKNLSSNLESEFADKVIEEHDSFYELMQAFKKPNIQPTPSMSSIFQRKVLEIWSNCVVKSARPWENKSNIIGETLGNDYCYYQDKLMEHRNEIMSLLYLVNNATNFEDLRRLNNGEEWTKLRQQAGLLMSLGNALRLVSFKNNKNDWDMKEAKNPEIAFSLSRVK